MVLANYGYANFYIPLTVSERYSRNEQKSKDLSFNESVSVAKNLEVLGNSKFTCPTQTLMMYLLMQILLYLILM